MPSLRSTCVPQKQCQLLPELGFSEDPARHRVYLPLNDKLFTHHVHSKEPSPSCMRYRIPEPGIHHLLWHTPDYRFICHHSESTPLAVQTASPARPHALGALPNNLRASFSLVENVVINTPTEAEANVCARDKNRKTKLFPQEIRSHKREPQQVTRNPRCKPGSLQRDRVLRTH